MRNRRLYSSDMNRIGMITTTRNMCDDKFYRNLLAIRVTTLGSLGGKEFTVITFLGSILDLI